TPPRPLTRLSPSTALFRSLPVEMAPTVLVCPVRRRPTASITGDAATASTPPSSPGHGALLTAAGTYDRPGGKACAGPPSLIGRRSEEHTSELQSREKLVCR